MRGCVDAAAGAGAAAAGSNVLSRAGAGSFDEHAAAANAAEMTRMRSGCNMLRVL